MNKKALVTGSAGMTGSHMSDRLLSEGYEVWGLIRRSSTKNLHRLKNALQSTNFHIIEGDVQDSSFVSGLIKERQFDAIYHFGAQSHVGHSFNCPIETLLTNTIGTANIVESVRHHSQCTKMIHASTSELYGGLRNEVYNENSVFHPRSAYGVSKLAAHWFCRNVRESYNLFVCNSISFNHEGPRRSPEFVTQKICAGVAEYANWLERKLDTKQPILELGVLDTKRDWSHAEDIVDGIYRIMQHDEADDFVLASGKSHSVREFVERAFDYINTNLEWRGKSENEHAIDTHNGNIVIRVNPKFYRPAEVPILVGDASKARKILRWKPKYSFEDLISDMMYYALDNYFGIS